MVGFIAAICAESAYPWSCCMSMSSWRWTSSIVTGFPSTFATTVPERAASATLALSPFEPSFDFFEQPVIEKTSAIARNYRER